MRESSLFLTNNFVPNKNLRNTILLCSNICRKAEEGVMHV